MTTKSGYVLQSLTEDDITALNLPPASILGEFGRFTGVLNDTTKPLLTDGIITLLRKYRDTKKPANKLILIEAMKRILRRSEEARKEYGVSDADNFDEDNVTNLLEDPDIQRKMVRISREEDHPQYDYGGRRRKTRRRKARRSTRRRKTSRR